MVRVGHWTLRHVFRACTEYGGKPVNYRLRTEWNAPCPASCLVFFSDVMEGSWVSGPWSHVCARCLPQSTTFSKPNVPLKRGALLPLAVVDTNNHVPGRWPRSDPGDLHSILEVHLRHGTLEIWIAISFSSKARSPEACRQARC